MSDPITGANDALNTASIYGPEVFLAVAVLLFCGGVLYLMFATAQRREALFLDVVANNTKALDSLAPILANICKDLTTHDQNTGSAVAEIHQIKPTIDRIDARTLATDSKVDKILWAATGGDKTK